MTPRSPRLRGNSGFFSEIHRGGAVNAEEEEGLGGKRGRS